jgi:S-adenosylmethionine:tRNA ribosyltransferase-isomerase
MHLPLKARAAQAPVDPALQVDEFDYALPPDLIAQHPSPLRSASRLLVVDGLAQQDTVFSQLGTFLQRGDLLVFNDTRVIKARLFGEKPSGGKVEVMVERVIGQSQVRAQLRASKPPKAGTQLLMQGGFTFDVVTRAAPPEERFYDLAVHGGAPILPLLEAHGHWPLPPYIAREDGADDATRYQTVFASTPGAVAAPTAGLHFDEATLENLHSMGVSTASITLHVGSGTFLPVQVARVADHTMHSEWASVPQATVDAVAQCKARGGRVVCVGTTVIRALESAALANGAPTAGARETDIFITPGFRFNVADRLLTNFHLPKSTLLMLVSAFAGREAIRAAYAHAIAQRYRFFSYGDAMLLSRAATPSTP